MDIPTIFAEWTSDDVLFPLLQVFLALFILFAIFQSWRAGRGSAKLTDIRDETSMSNFYASYAALSGLFIVICLSVDIAQNYRIFWVTIDTILVTYLCLSNVWFRNLLIDWTNQLTKIEQR